MSKLVRIGLVSILLAAIGGVVSPAWGTVENMKISPSVLPVGQPITFSGTDVDTTSSSNPMNLIFVFIYLGFGCSFKPSNSVAFTISSANSAGIYNTTLSFPASVLTSGQGYSGGWVVTNQSYQTGLPAGSYSAGITDAETLTANPNSGICKYFTITNSSPTPEFSDAIFVACVSLSASLTSLLFVRGRRHASKLGQ